MENEKIIESVTRLETKVEQHDREIVELKDTQKMIYEMNSNISRLVDKLGDTNDEISELKLDMKKDIGNLRTDVEEVKTKADKKDAEKLDKLKWLVYGAIITAIAGIIKGALGI